MQFHVLIRRRRKTKKKLMKTLNKIDLAFLYIVYTYVLPFCIYLCFTFFCLAKMNVLMFNFELI